MTTKKIHLDLEIFAQNNAAACYYTKWKKSKDGNPYPDHPSTTDYYQITCKRCLKMIETGSVNHLE